MNGAQFESHWMPNLYDLESHMFYDKSNKLET